MEEEILGEFLREFLRENAKSVERIYPIIFSPINAKKYIYVYIYKWNQFLSIAEQAQKNVELIHLAISSTKRRKKENGTISPIVLPKKRKKNAKKIQRADYPVAFQYLADLPPPLPPSPETTSPNTHKNKKSLRVTD